MVRTPKIDWKAKARPKKAEVRSKVLEKPEGGTYKRACLLTGPEMFDVRKGFEMGVFDEKTNFLFFEREMNYAEHIYQGIKELGLEQNAVLMPYDIEDCDITNIMNTYKGLQGGFDFFYLDLCGTINDSLAGWLAKQNSCDSPFRFLEEGARVAVTNICAFRGRRLMIRNRFPEALGEARASTLENLIKAGARWPISLEKAKNENAFYNALLNTELAMHCLWQYNLNIEYSERYHDHLPMLVNKFIVEGPSNKTEEGAKRLKVLIDTMNSKGHKHLNILG